MNDPTTDRLSDLLLAWEDARERGESIDPAQLCPDDPELLGRLIERIHALDVIASVLDLTASSGQEPTQIVTDEHAQTHSTNVQPHPESRKPPRPVQGTTNQLRPAAGVLRSQADQPKIPGYTILGRLGRGGMGVVYQAIQDSTDRTVAIKMILSGSHASLGQRKRFDNEAKLIARLNNQNIIQVYDVGTHDNVPFIVMEFADGGNVETVLRKHSTLSPREAAELIETLARAIDHAHKKGIIHRDLKPANILLQSSDQASNIRTDSPRCIPPGMIPKITDFGLARLLESSERHTETGYAVGTPAYMSPEQARQDDASIGPGSDIFSLGVILYQCLTGQRPFQAPTDWELMGKIVRNDPVPPSRLVPDLPINLQAICLKCLRKSPRYRYASAFDLAEDLKRFCEGQPTEATDLTRRQWLLRTGIGLAAAGTAMAGYFIANRSGPAVRIGVIQPLEGPMANPGQAVVDAVQLAVQEWNEKGGIHGRMIEVIEEDSGADAEHSAAAARQMIEEDEVACIIGGASSIERIRLQPVIDEFRHLMFFPADFEGIDDSPYIFHLGAVPNQLHLPCIDWWRTIIQRKRFFIIGVGTLYTGTVGTMIRSHLKRTGGELLDIGYSDVGSNNFDRVVQQAIDSQAEALLVLIRGNEGLGLFDSLRSHHLDPESMPVMWFGISEELLRGCVPATKRGHFLGSTYFPGIECPINEAFLQAYRNAHGQRSIPSQTMDSAYTAVHLWAQAALAAKSVNPADVRPLIRQQSFTAPGGPIAFAPNLNYVDRFARAGQFDATGRVVERWRSPAPIRPIPFPADRTPAQWKELRDQFLTKTNLSSG